MSVPPDESKRTKRQTFKPINKMDLTKFTKEKITDENLINAITFQGIDVWESADGNQWVSDWNGNLILCTNEDLWLSDEWGSTETEMFILKPLNQ